jgi:hypothetical protein
LVTDSAGITGLIFEIAIAHLLPNRAQQFHQPLLVPAGDASG